METTVSEKVGRLEKSTNHLFKLIHLSLSIFLNKYCARGLSLEGLSDFENDEYDPISSKPNSRI